MASYYPKEKIYFLDYIAAHHKRSGGGIGGALYERLRSEALLVEAKGIFFDCLSDDADHCLNKDEHKQNMARLKFYENMVQDHWLIHYMSCQEKTTRYFIWFLIP